MADSLEFSVEKEDAGKRADQFLSQRMEGKTRSAIQLWMEQGYVLCNEKAASKNTRLREGDQLLVTVPPLKEVEILPQNIPLEIVYEDEALLVVNKPKGMVVHPAPGNYENTLVNALLYHCKDSLSGINGVIRPGIVHRIDKDTSGLLLVAKNDQAHLSLAEQIKEHSLDRFYEAVVYGGFPEDDGTVNAPIGRSEKDRKKMCVTHKNAREAVTHYHVLERRGQFTHLRLKLETGRTHQIRVHMAYIGHPVAGDPVYGPKKVIASLKGQCLHAKSIGFTHPVTQERMYFESPLPAYFAAFIRQIEKQK